MAVLVKLILLLLLAGLVISVMTAIIAWLVDIAVRFIVALALASIVFGIGIGLEVEGWAVALLSLSAFAMTFGLLAHKRERKVVPPALPDLPAARWMRQHRAIGRAWQEIAALSPESVAELQHAERACASLLRIADEKPGRYGIDLELIELAQLIKRHIPDLGKALQSEHKAGPFRCDCPGRKLAQSLVVLGQRTQSVVDRIIRSREEEFRLQFDHFDRRLREFGRADRHSETLDLH